MAHPYKSQADTSHKSKASSIGKVNNLDIPVMRAVGENSSKKIAMSSNSMQHKDQSGDAGMKRGGHVGKPKHSKPKIALVPDAAPAAPDPALAAAAAGPPPAAPGAMPPPGQPPMKRGGKVMGPKMKGGADSGLGRLEHSKAVGMKPIKG